MGKRKIKACSILVVMIICFSFCIQTILAQTPSVRTIIDKTDILIGEQIQYKVTATIPAGIFKVHWFTVPDSVAHFEVVDRSKIDSSSDNNNTVLEQTITFTSFDSGKWNTPAFVINVEPVNNNKAINLFTDSIAVNVGYAPADTTNQLRDIKTIMEVKVEDYFWYYAGGGILLLLILLILLWRYFKNRKKTPDLVFRGKQPPYDEAMQALEKLKGLNLQNAEEIKQYHARLAEIFKWYISRKQRISIMNKTTGDVLVHLTSNNLVKEVISDAATALRCGDAVKFAKFLPTAIESEECFNKVKGTINFIQQSKTTGNEQQAMSNRQ
jgi:hypothetical protein